MQRVYFDAVITVSGVAFLDAPTPEEAQAWLEADRQSHLDPDDLPPIGVEHITALTVTDVEPDDE